MKRSIEAEVALACYAMVSGEFAMFCDPLNRGDNFSWDRFPDMQVRHAKTSIWMYVAVPSSEKLKEEIESKAKEFAKEIANTLVTRSGFVKPQVANKVTP